MGLLTELPLMKKGDFSIIVAKHVDYRRTSNLILEYMTGAMHYQGCYVSLDQTYQEVEDLFDAAGIQKKDFFFLVKPSKGISHLKNVYPMEKEGSLTEISLTISELFKTGRVDFIFFESFSSTLVYNPLMAVVNFTEFLFHNLKSHHVEGLALTLDGEGSSRILPKIYSFYDHCLIL